MDVGLEDCVAEYDDIIVGGGSAGLALATRLTEDEARRVLLIEAGPDHRVRGRRPARRPDAVLGHAHRLGDRRHRSFPAATRSTTRRAGRWAAGPRSTARSPSAVCATTTSAGPRSRARNGRGRTCCASLCRLEADQDFGGEAHGTDGPVPVVRWRPDELLPAQQAFLTAVMDHGIPWVEDLNAPDASGIGAMPMNRRDGVRMSTALTYLPLARQRENLTIWPGTEVTRVLLEHGRATGVEYPRNGRLQQVSGSRVVLCAGALQSPTLLLRSGIGPAGHLAEVGGRLRVDLPGVGENLMDHQGTAVFLIPRDELAPPDAACASSGRATRRRLGTADDDMWLSMWSPWDLTEFPDMQSRPRRAVDQHAHRRRARPGVAGHACVCARTDPGVAAGRSTSGCSPTRAICRGSSRVCSSSSTWRRSRVFTESYEGIGLLDPSSRERPGRPSRPTSSRRWAAGTTLPAPAGWAPIPTSGAVVDARLRVHGVDALHVVDASVMPTVVRAPTNLSSIAIGERAAEFLR